MSETSKPALPVAAQYVATFLKPEMLHVYRQIRSLREFRPVVLCQKRENAARFPFPDVVAVPKPRTHQLRRLWQKQILGRPITIYRSEARRLRARLHDLGAAVLHVYFGHIGVHLLPLIEISDIPVVVSFHGADAQVDLHLPAHADAARRMLARVDLALVRSESIGDRLRALGCDPGKIRVHRTGIPLDEIPFAERAVPADGAWRCVQACRLIPKKGLPTSLRAFAAFAARHPRAEFVIAGEGPQLAELKMLAATLGVADRVRFPGFLSQDELRVLYARSHLFLHPSELGPDGDQEGVPNAMLEAMASGLPVAATRHGGIPEAVDDAVSGMLVAERDHEALAARMLALSDDPDAYARMSRAASEAARARFDLSAQGRVLEACYREAIQRRAESAPAPPRA